MTKIDARFKGVVYLYGQSAFRRFQSAHVAVCGIGGVGSWVVESLARSGIGELTLIDLDEVCVSNTNRQVHALQSTVGKAKVTVMKQRCHEINPALKVHDKFDFVTPDNVLEYMKTDFDFFVDATDSAQTKYAIAFECHKRHIPLVMIGATGGKIDPARIRLSPLRDVSHDRLAKRVRRIIKSECGMTLERHLLKVPTVYSLESPRFPDGQGGVCSTQVRAGAQKLDCADGLGSASFVTGTFAFFAASHVLRNLAK